MRVLARTLPLHAALVCGAALLGACDADVTRPVDRRAAKPEAILFGTSWIRSELPFAPSAINTAGTIVGTNGSEAVVWQNGVLDTLPHHIQLPGPYAAVDISPNGAIVGTANGHVLYWRTPSSPPNDASAGLSYVVYPTAINDSYTIVGWSFLVYGATSKRFTPTGGWVDIGLGLGFFASDQTIVTSLNANGQAAGYLYRYNRGSSVPLRWGTSGSPVQLPAPIDANSDPSGRGISIDGAGNVFGSTSAGATIWHPDGSTVLVTGLPAQPSLRSDAGRFVGVAYNNNSGVYQPFTSFNGALTWLSYPDAGSPTMVDVNNCGVIIAKRATTPATGFVWRQSGILYTCDTPPVNTLGMTKLN